MKLLAIHFEKAHLPLNQMIRNLSAPKEVILSCPFMAQNLQPCPSKLIIDNEKDLNFVICHILSHVADIDHQIENLVDFVKNQWKKNAGCPFHDCNILECKISIHHKQELALFILYNVNPNDKIIEHILQVANETIKFFWTALKNTSSTSEISISKSGKASPFNLEPITGNTSEPRIFLKPQGSESEKTMENTQTVTLNMPVEQELSKKLVESDDLECSFTIKEVISVEPEKECEIESIASVNNPNCDDTSMQIELSQQSQDQVNISNETNTITIQNISPNIKQKKLQIYKRKHKLFEFFCNICKTVCDTMEELADHLVNFQCSNKSNQDIAVDEDDEFNDASFTGKCAEIRVFDITFSKYWNKRVCRSWQQFIDQQPDEYLIENFHCNPAQVCKLPGCGHSSNNLAQHMKHIRYAHAK